MEEEDFECDSVERDEDYEFDACQFYDFTRPENDSQIHEVERWFQVSGDYPHSPFVVKLNLEKILVCPEAEGKSDTSSSESKKKKKKEKNIGKEEKGIKAMLQDVAIKSCKTKPPSKSFMQPTASHLAKIPKAHAPHNQYLCTRFQRTTAKLDQMRTCHHNLATKRQKLDIGYLKKGSRLKHQFFLPHKSSKKVTVPREPELETQLRAQRRRSKNSFAASESEKQKQPRCNFKAQPPTRKILHARPLPQHRKRKPPSPDFQVPHSKTTQRDNHSSSAKENKLSAGDKLSENKLIGQFNELSLASNMENHNASQLKRHSSAKLSLASNMENHNASQLKRHSSAKALNKDGSDSFQAEFCRRHSKPNHQCGHMMVHEASMARIASN